MDGLGLAEPVAVTLVRRGHRTVEDARAFLEAADDHDPFLFEAMAEVCERIRGGRRRRAADHRPRRLRRRRRLLDRDRRSAPLRELGADCDWLIPGPPGGRLRADRGDGRAARGARDLAADHDRLRDRLGRGGRGGAGRGDRGDRHRPSPAGRDAARVPDPAPGDLAAIRSPSCARPGSPTSWPSALRAGRRRPSATSTWSRWRRSPTWSRCAARTGRLVRRGLAVARRARRPGLRALLAVSSLAPERLDEGDLAFRLGPRINAAGPPLPRRRRGRADADRRPGPGRRDRRRARARQPRAPGDRARGGGRRRGEPARAARRSSPTRRASCWPARAGTPAWSGSSPRGWSSATGGPSS